MDLQRSAAELQLRMGIHTGICDIGSFRCGEHVGCTLIGPEMGLVAKVAATAAVGSISVSPETYALVKEDVLSGASDCLLTEEFRDSDLAQVCLTPTPVRGDNNSGTFASLGV